MRYLIIILFFGGCTNEILLERRVADWKDLYKETKKELIEARRDLHKSYGRYSSKPKKLAEPEDDYCKRWAEWKVADDDRREKDKVNYPTCADVCSNNEKMTVPGQAISNFEFCIDLCKITKLRKK